MSPLQAQYLCLYTQHISTMCRDMFCFPLQYGIWHNKRDMQTLNMVQIFKEFRGMVEVSLLLLWFLLLHLCVVATPPLFPPKTPLSMLHQLHHQESDWNINFSLITLFLNPSSFYSTLLTKTNHFYCSFFTQIVQTHNSISRPLTSSSYAVLPSYPYTSWTVTLCCWLCSSSLLHVFLFNKCLSSSSCVIE